MRSSASVSSIKQGKNRKLSLTQVIERVFELFIGDYGRKNNIEIPVRFYEFYNHSLLKNLLVNCMNYFYAYIKIMQLYEQIPIDEPLRTEDKNKKKNKIKKYDEYEKARELQIESLNSVSKAYSRVILSCSNFEQSQDDIMFYECIYHFAFLVLKQSVNPQPFSPNAFWNTVRCELSFMFRGLDFSIEKRKQDQEEKDLLLRKQDVSDKSMHSAKDDSNKVSLPDNSQIGVESIHNMLQKGMYDFKAPIRKLPIQSKATKSTKFSVYKAVNATSPALQLLLMTPSTK